MRACWPLLVAAAILLGGSVAWAAIPDANGVIHGCVKNGNLRVADTDAGDSCKGNEEALDWNQSAQPSGLSLYQIVSGDPVVLGPGASGEAQVACPDGTRAVGGGYITGPFVRMTSVIPAGGGTVWSAAGRNESDTTPDSIRARVICAAVTP
jgi:hypothetical protein